MTRPGPRGRLSRLLRGIGALIVLIAVVAGVPILMSALHMVPHSIPSGHELRHALTQRDNGQLVGVVLAGGVWICWALFTVALLPEIAAAARQRPPRPLPGVAGFQRPAAALIAAITVGFAIAPLISGAAAARAGAAPAPPLPRSRPAAAATTFTAATTLAAAPSAQGQHHSGWDESEHGHTTYAATSAPVSAPAPATGPGPTYLVQRRDTLWKIAEDHLGDPMRYPEIVGLNPTTIGPDNEITAGAALVMPADATGLPGLPGLPAPGMTEVRVEAGDTLWSIEQRITGSGADWPSGWDANQGRVEAGGERFDDPNLIKPGWQLDIPASPSAPRAAPPSTPRPSPPTSQPSTPPPPPSPSTTPTAPGGGRADPPSTRPATASTTPTATSPASASASAAATPTSAPAGHAPDPLRAGVSSQRRHLWLEAGGGGLLAACTFTAVMAHRRRRFRHRRPGHVVASLPPELAPLGQAGAVGARAGLATMTFLDLALRELAERIGAQPDGALPDIVGAGISDDRLELYLAGDPGRPPPPWLAADPLTWTLPRGAEPAVGAAGRLAPYPCLVSVGAGPDGTEYLLDLEHAGALRLVGDPARCLDLARYLVAELANNVWSDHLTVTVAGFARELIAANPTRLAHTDDPHAAAATLSRIARDNRAVAGQAGVDVLEGRLRGVAADVWMPHVLLAAPDTLEEDVDDDAALLRAAVGAGRAAVAVVLLGGPDPGEARHHGDTCVEVTGDGRLLTSLLPVADLTAFGLPLADAADIARAVALERDGAVDEPTPPSTGDGAWDEFADAAGALRHEYTVPRDAAPAAVHPAGPVSSSVLPAPDEAYLAAAATTAADLADLAPAVTAQMRAAVEQADPDLDELVAAWHDPHAGLARLQVLGPVRVTAHGRPLAKQVDFCIEIVAYLWTKPHGVSTNQFAADLWPAKNYTGTDSHPKQMASRVRHWLGTDPRTGREYWPRARRDGVQGYRLDGLLVDYDLFRRLRVRGHARGADGLPDLLAALDLVSGPPLSQLRDFGYGWLPVGDELLYQGAIAEVCHLVATRALEAGDDAAAIRACEIALHLDAADDRALLALAKAHEHAGRDAEKDATILRLTRLDDPPARTLEVMRRNGWLARRA